MIPIDPRPRAGIPPLGKQINWPNAEVVAFDFGKFPDSERTFVNVLRQRRSIRNIKAASQEEVASVVRQSMQYDFIGAGEKKGRKLKATVSAGGLHPVKAIIVRRDEQPLYYDDVLDCFFLLPIVNSYWFGAFEANCSDVLPHAHGHWIALIADCRDLDLIYSDYLSLLWRDSGAVIQTLALVAEASGLGFCPLGILGHEIIKALRQDDNELVAVGVVTIGQVQRQ